MTVLFHKWSKPKLHQAKQGSFRDTAVVHTKVTELYQHSRFVVPVVEEVVGFDVPVNNSKLVDVTQGLQQVVDVLMHLLKAQWPNDVLINTFWQYLSENRDKYTV